MKAHLPEIQERRAKVFLVLTWACFAFLFGKLWMLQVIRGASNFRLSVETTTYDIVIPAPRGVFYDRHGRLLVANRSGYDVTGLLDELKKRPEVITRLAGILGCDPQDIQTRLNTPGVQPCTLYPLAKNVPVPIALKIKESLDLPGIEVQEVSMRNYIHGDYATHVFGYIREISPNELAKLRSSGYQMGSMIGKTGLERTLEPYLRGENGVRRIEVDRYQVPVRELEYRDPVPGLDAVLTLDYGVQKAAEEALRARLNYLQKYTKYKKARAGAVIALDPRNGEILASASLPSFDPNLFVNVVPAETFAKLNTNRDKPFNNRVLSGLYPPASTFKPFTVLAALQDGKVAPEELFRCNGFDRVYKGKARCWIASQGRGHGVLNVAGGLKNSCNVVMYELGRRLGVERLAHYARLFGFGRSTELDLAPYDAKGIVPDQAYKQRIRPGDPWRELETLHFAIGQGYLEVTPIQLALAYAALANGSYVPRPNLVREIRTVEGRIVRRFKGRRTLSQIRMDPAQRALVLEGLNEVVTGGTAAGAFAGFPLDKIPVAGKTGTGQKKGYDDYAVFACFAPADRPRIVVVVVIEQGGSGSGAAAPVARRILEAFFKIQPSSAPPARPRTEPAPTIQQETAGTSPPASASIPPESGSAESSPADEKPPEQPESSGD